MNLSDEDKRRVQNILGDAHRRMDQVYEDAKGEVAVVLGFPDDDVVDDVCNELDPV